MFGKAVPLFVLFCICLTAGVAASAEDETGGENPIAEAKLAQAVMCESIEGYAPRNIAVVFSIEVGKISCYTSFDEVPATTYTVHKWFRHDEAVTSKRLTLKPPRWATYSSIQLREADKGPWRVEIYNGDDKLIRVLRFSVTD